MIFGMVYGGAVKHIGKGEDRTVCGRYVMIAGDSDAPLCKTCSRITGVVEKRPVHVAADNPYGFTAVAWTATQYTFAAEALENATPEDLATRFYAFYVFQLNARKLKADGPKAELTIMKGGKGDHSTVSKGKPARKPKCGASEDQAKFLRSLAAESDALDIQVNGDNAVAIAHIFDDEYLENIAWDKISPRIDFLKARIAELKAKLPKTSAKPVAVAGKGIADGVYCKNGEYFKVKHNQAGTRQYAVKWCDSSWEYTPGAVATLSMADALTPEAAKAFGDLYGACCVCSRLLTDEESIVRGIGPVCASKQGW